MSRRSFFLLLFTTLIICTGAVLFIAVRWRQKPAAGLQVITDDTPTSVFLNGQYLDKSPLIERNLQPGTYSIKITPDDETLVPYETTIELQDGTLGVITWKPGTSPEKSGGVMYEMEKLSNDKTSELSFITIPDNAVVAVADRDRSLAPITLTDIEPGDIEYEITLPSYETQRHIVHVNAGYRVIVSAKLAKLDAPLPVTEQAVELPTATQAATPDVTASDTASASASATASAQKSVSTPTQQTVRITTTNFFQDGIEVLRMRQEPNTTTPTLLFIPVGEELTLLGEVAGWHQVQYQGQQGWISADFSQKQ